MFPLPSSSLHPSSSSSSRAVRSSDVAMEDYPGESPFTWAGGSSNIQGHQAGSARPAFPHSDFTTYIDYDKDHDSRTRGPIRQNEYDYQQSWAQPQVDANYWQQQAELQAMYLQQCQWMQQQRRQQVWLHSQEDHYLHSSTDRDDNAQHGELRSLQDELQRKSLEQPQRQIGQLMSPFLHHHQGNLSSRYDLQDSRYISTAPGHWQPSNWSVDHPPGGYYMPHASGESLLAHHHAEASHQPSAHLFSNQSEGRDFSQHSRLAHHQGMPHDEATAAQSTPPTSSSLPHEYVPLYISNVSALKSASLLVEHRGHHFPPCLASTTHSDLVKMILKLWARLEQNVRQGGRKNLSRELVFEALLRNANDKLVHQFLSGSEKEQKDAQEALLFIPKEMEDLTRERRHAIKELLIQTTDNIATLAEAQASITKALTDNYFLREVLCSSDTKIWKGAAIRIPLVASVRKRISGQSTPSPSFQHLLEQLTKTMTSGCSEFARPSFS